MRPSRLVSGALSIDSCAIGSLGAAALLLCTVPLCGQQAPSIRLRPAEIVFNGSDEEFSQVTAVRELADGRLLVADRLEGRIVLLDPVSRRVTPIGRRGRGPGEYSAVGGLYALRGDSTLLTDPTTRRWHIVSGDRIVNVPVTPIASQFGSALGGIDSLGRVLGVVGFRVSSTVPVMRDRADSLLVLRLDRATQRVDTIARIRGQGPQAAATSRMGVGAPAVASPYTSEDLAVVFADGWVAVAYTSPYRVDWRMPAGRWVRGAPLPFTGRNLNDREKCAVYLQLADRAYGNCGPAMVRQWPGVLPPFLPWTRRGQTAPLSPTVLAIPDGRLLIRRAPSPNSTATMYDIVDRRGALVGVLALPSREAVIGFGVRSVYVLATDSDGIQSLRRHPWP
jgi:hypothetical protein